MKSQLFDTEQGEQFPSFLSNLDLHVQVMFLIMVKLHYRQDLELVGFVFFQRLLKISTHL